MRLAMTMNDAKLAKLQKKLGPDVIVPPVATLIRMLGEITQREASSNAPHVLASVIDNVRVSELAAKVVARHPGARAMEAGRKPLAAGGNYPPPQAFAYISPDLDVQFAIARAVARRGTKGRFFMKKARAAANRALPTEIRKASDAIKARWAAS